MRLSLLAVAVGVLALPLVARADTLSGDTINVAYAFPTTAAIYVDAGNYVVPASGVLTTPPPNPFQLAAFTLAPTQISISNSLQQTFTNADFNGFEFTDLNPNTDITNVTIDPSSTLATGVVTFTSNEIFLNLQGIGLVNAGVTEVLDVTAVSTTMAATTPEPSSIALLGTGLLGVLGTMRRRFVRS